MTVRRRHVIVLCVVAVACGIAFVAFDSRRAGGDSPTAEDRPEDVSRARTAAGAETNRKVRGFAAWKKEGIGKPNPKRRAVASFGATVSEFSAEEQKTVDGIQSALDNDNLAKLKKELGAASASTNAAVRKRAVEALQWFGKNALPELTMFMADDDDEVRKDAIDAWTAGVSQMEAGEAKARTVVLGMNVVTDREQLESMVMQVNDLTDFQKIDALTQVIDGKNAVAAEVAKGHYKFWTSEEYVDIETAQKWLDAQSTDSQDGESAE